MKLGSQNLFGIWLGAQLEKIKPEGLDPLSVPVRKQPLVPPEALSRLGTCVPIPTANQES